MASQKTKDRVFRILAGPASIFGATWRFKRTGPEEYNPFACRGSLFCFWHGQIFPVAYFHRRSGIVALISRSSDGERIARVMNRWGINSIRGSSHRKSLTGLRQSVRTLTAGGNVIITPDGPRGPREVVKPGIAQISLVSSVPIITVRAIPRTAYHLSSWDRFMIPAPFTSIEMQYGRPILPLNEDGSKKSIVELTELVKEGLSA